MGYGFGMSFISKAILRILAAICLSLVMAAGAAADQFTVVSNILPPIKFTRNGKPIGIAVDILKRIARDTDLELDSNAFQFIPWNQAYDMTRDQPRTICLAMARTPDREELFKWVGPIYTTRLGLIAEKTRDVVVGSLEDAHRYSIASVIDSAPEKILLREGYPESRLIRRARVEDSLTLLTSRQVDMFAFAKSPTLFAIMDAGQDPSRYRMVLELMTVDLYLAFNKTTSDDLIKQLQAALDAMKLPGPNGESEYDVTIGSYFVPGM